MEMNNPEKKAALVWITRDKDLVPEMLGLCSSAGYDINVEIGQGKKIPDPRFYMGPGKIKEIGSLEIDHIITVSDLTPSQLFNISSVTGKIVADRTRVILDLFKKRANSPEARMQVEIADLRYQLPVLREYIHQGKMSERPGFMAGGEYKIDYYYDMIKKRITQLRRKVEGERRRRGRKRALRRRRGAHLVSIAGYTNAGKSTLLNKIIDTDREDKTTEVGGAMFTTISTTTRKMKGDRGCLVSDTVGFIRDLPPWLVEGFMSTLEEIFEADIVVLVIDVSESLDLVERKFNDSLSILQNGGTEGKIIIVMNKIDLVDEEIVDIENVIRKMIPDGFDTRISNIVPISAEEDYGITELVQNIHELLPPLVDVVFELPIEKRSTAMIVRMRSHAFRFDEDYYDEGIKIRCLMEERWIGHFKKRAEEIGGKVLINSFELEIE
jgi:GTP-binding protein HflX